MKYFALLLLMFVLISCEEKAPKDYVIFSGSIVNQNSDSLVVANRGYRKVISVRADGTFQDTLKLTPAMYFINDGTESSMVFLRNGYDLNLTTDTEQFDESIQYSGSGSAENNYLAQKALKEEQLFDIYFGSMNREELDKTLSDASDELNGLLNKQKKIDTLLVAASRQEITETIASLSNYYGSIIALRETFPPGSPSPVFEGYENFKGGTTSLTDLKGTYVYIDVWATWCAPCKYEIPYLKELEAEMHDKNIAFVSLSIDDDQTHKGSWEQAKADWRQMVTDKELGGIQIMAPKGWQSQFIEAYQVKGIPRFILIDPEGNVVTPDAPRPSDPELKILLADLL